MLHLRRDSRRLEDRSFREFPDLLRPDDLLVLNNSRVLPARLFGHRSGSRAQRVSAANPATREFLRGKVEVLLTKQLSTSPQEWEALVHPGRKLGVGERVYFGGDASEHSHELAAEIVDRGSFGERRLRFDPVDDFFAVLNRIGHIPLPPYIDRPDTESRSRAIPDGICEAARLGCRSDGRPALYAGDPGSHSRAWNRDRRSHAARGIRNIPAGTRGSGRSQQAASRVV